LAVCTGGAEDVSILEHHRAVWQPMRMATGCPSTFSVRAVEILLLHLRRGVQGGVGARKGGHDLIAHGLDDLPWRCSVACASRRSDRHHVGAPAGRHSVVKAGRSDDVGQTGWRVRYPCP